MSSTNREIRRRLKLRLRALQQLHAEARRAGDRSAYNQAAYRLARRIDRSRDKRRILRALGLGADDGPGDIVAVIMRRSSDDDRRLIHKHATALKLMAIMNVESGRVLEQIDEFGGYNACTESYREYMRESLASA